MFRVFLPRDGGDDLSPGTDAKYKTKFRLPMTIYSIQGWGYEQHRPLPSLVVASKSTRDREWSDAFLSALS